MTICKTLFMTLSMTMAAHVAVANTITKYEAENATPYKCEYTTGTKYSAGKAIKMTDAAASLTLNINVDQRQKYDIYIMAEGIGGEKVVNCSVNGASTSFRTNSLGEVNAGTFILTKGTNTIRISPNWTWFNIDYIRIEANNSDIAFDISGTPVTQGCTSSAQELYAFLYDNFGQRTISGMMTGSMDKTDGKNIKGQEDVAAVYKASGNYPALVGFDFSNATGSEIDKGNTWYKGYMDKEISLAKDLWRKGGIPNFTWHWHDPSRATFEFYSDKAKMKISSAMNSNGTWNTSSTLYRQILKDIDVVANYFLDLQREGIACIFRPLHEASGGWFWWGADGSENCKKLYQLIYHEMVNVKGVKNVIWDWNADYNIGAAWCPGEAYYDIISTDIYNDAYDYSSNYAAFDKLKSLSAGKKIITLAENGPIPDIDHQAEDQAMWSWWMPWYQSWDGGFVDKTSTSEWKKCMSDPRIITLDDMPGWNSSTAVITPQSTAAPADRTYSIDGMRLPATHSAHSNIQIINSRKILIHN